MAIFQEKVRSTVGLIADSFASSTAGNVAPAFNYLLNGNFELGQRGTTAVLLNSGGVYYRLDRWGVQNNLQSFVSRQSWTSGGAHPGNSNLVMRVAGDGSTNMYLNICQGIDSNLVIGMMRGKTFTLSGYIRFSAATITGSGSHNIFLGYTTATADQSLHDHNYIATDAAAVAIVNGSYPTTWQFFTVTFAIPTTANNVAVDFEFANSVVYGAGDYYELSLCMLNEGATAAEFSYQGGSYIDDRLRCRRYYEVLGIGMMGSWASTTTATVGTRFVIEKRTTPSIVLRTTTPTIVEIGVAARTGTASTISVGAVDTLGVAVDVDGFLLATATRGAEVQTGTFIAADAEL